MEGNFLQAGIVSMGSGEIKYKIFCTRGIAVRVLWALEIYISYSCSAVPVGIDMWRQGRVGRDGAGRDGLG